MLRVGSKVVKEYVEIYSLPTEFWGSQREDPQEPVQIASKGEFASKSSQGSRMKGSLGN